MHFAFYILHFTFCLSACTDVLDIAPDGNLNMEDIYSDPVKVEALLATIYAGVPQKGFCFSEYTPLAAVTDDGWEANGEHNGLFSYWVYHKSNTAGYHSIANAHNGWNKNYWENFYTSIRLCNQFIQNADKMAFSTENSNSKNRLVAEARVLRAYFYTDLVKFFGPVPIIKDVLPLDFDFSVLERNSVYEVAKFVAEDCDAALATTELPWRITSGAVLQITGSSMSPSGEAFRMTKALAHALKSTAMLFAASPLHDANGDHWSEAYQFCKAAVDALSSNGYALFSACTQPDIFGNGGAAAFHEMMCKVADYSATPRDCETIYQTVAAGWVASLLWHVNYVGNSLPGNAYVGTTPTQELVDAFEYVKNGVAYPLLDLENPYLDEKHLQPNFNSDAIAAGYAVDGYNEEAGSDPYANRDPRLRATMLVNGDIIDYPGAKSTPVSIDIYVGEKGSNVADGLFAISTDPKERGWTKTGYYFRKIITPGMSASAGQGNPHTPTYKHYRFAELLLNLAETANEVGQTDEALQALNLVRARVEMPEVTETDPHLLRLRIRNERRVELAFEENRYYDLRRWCLPNGDLGKYQKYLTAMWITKRADGTFSYERKIIGEGERGGWENRDLLLPLPLSEVSSMEPLTGKKWQNPGW
ncbi:MAG: RagB/SusD family nutrient uptake outer membrane protein [Prevotellaceae bacterium]|nr:RagB/SusD family nutrient uptake outer membrane protein [Prevotellaceae bacterium]